jgi:hypothetical protein
MVSTETVKSLINQIEYMASLQAKPKRCKPKKNVKKRKPIGYVKGDN